MSGVEGAVLLSIPEVLKTIGEMISLINNRHKDSRIQQMEEKGNRDKKLRFINKRHMLYYDQVFLPLYRNIIAIDDQSKNIISYVIFTASSVSKSLHYREALEHLNNDIQNFSTRLNELQHLISMFNTDLKDFQERRLLQIIIDHILQNGLSVHEYDEFVSKPGSINTQYVLEALKDFWKHHKEISYIIRDNELRIPVDMGHATIVLLNESVDVNKIKEIINQLKDLDKIKIEFNKFLEEYRQIDNQSKNLSGEIGTNIVKLVENGEYDYSCKLCKDKILK